MQKELKKTQLNVFLNWLMMVKLDHHPIYVPTAGAQAFLMDYPQGELGSWIIMLNPVIFSSCLFLPWMA
jgi:hypothetical protein